MSPTSLLEHIGLISPVQPKPEAKPLLAALQKLEIEPLNQTAVNTYKKYKLEKEWELLQQKLQRAGWYHHVSFGGYTGIVRSQLGSTWTDDDKYAYLAFSGGDRYPTCFAMGWHRSQVSLSDLAVNSDVPEYVTRKAEAIRNEVPTATLEVDKLEDRQTAYDPFLVVKLGDEEYYVEVWNADERDFIR